MLSALFAIRTTVYFGTLNPDVAFGDCMYLHVSVVHIYARMFSVSIVRN